jgi:hypothetical protein
VPRRMEQASRRISDHWLAARATGPVLCPCNKLLTTTVRKSYRRHSAQGIDPLTYNFLQTEE